MRVSQIQILTFDQSCQLQARVECDAHPDAPHWFAPFLLWHRYPQWCQPFLSAENGDPFVAALLAPAMRAGERLLIEAPISPRLRESLPEIQDIYAAFDPRARRITVEATERTHPLSSERGQWAGLFFSMGVDSFYSLLKNDRDHPADAKTVTHLISVHGFDAAHDGWDEDFPPMLLERFERVAAETGKNLLPVITNVRRYGARLAPWTLLHGGAMASIALALGDAFSRVLIAASATYSTMQPWGTHPLLDPLWSTEALTFVHDGCEMDTIDKTRFIIHSPLVLDTLRVCPGYSSAYNCGRCMKCLRTMIDLMQAGTLDRCSTLPHEIDPEAVRMALRMPAGPVHLAAFRRRLEMLEASGGPAALREVLAEHLAQSGAGAVDSWRRWRLFERWRHLRKRPAR